jgi:tRNA-dihydrouridine synthase C
MLTASSPALILAPMEGVTDAPMRALQGATGAFTFSVSEFLRVSQTVPGSNAFLRHVPELRTTARTPTGLPVQVQLLGGDADRLAAAAVIAHEAGARAIDLNFGCPARTVNRHDGGATLLKHPQRIREIVRTVRDAVPRDVPVSAKLRLGWDCVESIHENAAMAAEGGASWLTIHARTRTQGYAPPVYWPLVGRVRERLAIPVIANGDIWTLDDFRRCRDETGCRHFMLGRGALADPGLAQRVAAELGLIPKTAGPPPDWPSLIRDLVDWTVRLCERGHERVVFRAKQWLRLAAVHGSFDRFEQIKRARTTGEVLAILEGPRVTCAVNTPSASVPAAAAGAAL